MTGRCRSETMDNGGGCHSEAIAEESLLNRLHT